jgi:nitroimidazol reductase NimA-like FMN-containing flavoprotein (pyridoxamine 5'-phosphate oxidase superfamily)
MRKKDREIVDFEEIEQIIEQNCICRVAMVNGTHPYLVPLNYGYHERTFYFHTGSIGMKIDILKRNPEVCIEIEQNIQLQVGATACKYSVNYQTVIVLGTAEFIEDSNEKINALRFLMKNTTKNENWDFPTEIVEKTCVFRVVIREIFGKKRIS